VKVFGPVQLYVPPATVFEKSVSVLPEQTGVLLLNVGAAGVLFTTTATVLCALTHPPTVMVSEYVPVAAVVAETMLGSSSADENEFGPVQLYVAPATVFAVRFNVWPEHNGLLLPTVGAAGVGFTTTVVVLCGLVQPPIEIVSEYVPDAATVTLPIVGSSSAELKLFGPVQLYVPPATVLEKSVSVLPEQTGVLLLSVGAAGVFPTITETVLCALTHPPTVIVSE
jgi:hypothetical protein